jgi:lysophospholipase L1-like esterase
MEVDPSKIPVEPIPFEHGLFKFARSLSRGQGRVVAIGSSSTFGEPSKITPYPERLESFLRELYPQAGVRVVNKGVNGQEAPIELLRFDRDVIAEKPDLVIWQIGTNAIWQSPDSKPPPPSFGETTAAIREGVTRLRGETQADVILMDLQYLPGVLTPAKRGKAAEMVEAIAELARAAEVNVFRRFVFMKGLIDVEQVSIDRMTSPNDDERRLHQSDWATNRVAWGVRLAIGWGVDKANAALAAKAS